MGRSEVIKKVKKILGNEVQLSEPVESIVDTGFNYIKYKLRSKNTPGLAASFSLSQMLGCCGAAHIFDVYGYNNKHVSKVLQITAALANYYGYSLLFATDRKGGQMHKIWTRSHTWKLIHTFQNRRTGNTVELRVRAV